MENAYFVRFGDHAVGDDEAVRTEWVGARFKFLMEEEFSVGRI
jgi:hypothetical protein